MPYYQNSLYGRGVPSYAEQLSPLADVFKAFAPNPLRDIQVAGYASTANLNNLKGLQIRHELGALDEAGNAVTANDPKAYYANVARSGNAGLMQHAPGLVSGEYAARAIGDPNSVDQDTLATLTVGAGGNYKNTAPGFEADQSRQLQQNENTTAASRYGSELQAGVGHEGNRLRYDASIYGSDQQAGASRYGADQSRLAREFDTLHDIRKTTSGGGRAALANKVDPVKLDNAVMQSLPGSFKDAKGRWQVDPSVTPADLAEVRTRVAARVQANPSDQYGAVQQAIADVYGSAPTMTPEVQGEENWIADDVPAVPAQVVSLPQDKRPPRPTLGQQFAAPPVSAPAVPSMPSAPVAAAPNADLAAAKNAIASGKSRQAVIDRLLKGGYSAQQIQAAGI